MFGPDDEAACSGCSFTADSLAGAVTHIENRDVSFVAVSRAPLERLLAYRERMGWSFPVGVLAGQLQRRLRGALGFELNGMELHGLSAFAQGGRTRLPHLFHGRPRHRRAVQLMAAARPRTEGARRASSATGRADTTNTRRQSMLADSKAFSGFAVPDIEEARRFYGDTLGLKVEVIEGTGPPDAAPGRRPPHADLPQAGLRARHLHDPELPGG